MKREDILVLKAKNRLDVNRSLIGIAFSIFIFIIALNSSLLKDSIFLPIELTAAIPFLLTSIFARSKLAYAKRSEMWERFGNVTFLIGYSFLINAVGILLSSLIEWRLGMLFFAINIILPLIYSKIELIENSGKLKSRIMKDGFFIIILILGGVLPSLRVY